MKNFRLGILSVACLGLAASAAQAQDRWADRLFWHVREDLNRVEASSFSGHHDRHRLDRTRRELDDLQERFNQHRPDGRELNEVIGSLGNVVADNRMRPEDRDLLNEDLRRLNDFRARHEGWGWQPRW